MAKVPSTSTPAKLPRRRLWQHLCRALVAGVLLLGGAYVTLPWWLPTDAVRERLAADLALQTGCDVTIGAVRVSWDEGIDIRDLVIQNPAGFDSDPLLIINHLRADFSPLRLLAGKPIEYVDIEDPHLRVQFNEDGQSNVAALTNAEGEFSIRRVSIRQAVVDVHLPHASHLLRVNVGDLQVLSGRLSRLAQVTMSAALRQETVPAPVSFRLWSEPKEPMAAHASLNVSNIQLDQLPLAKLLNLPLAKLTGVCGGNLDLHLSDRGVVEQFDLNLLVRGLDVDGPEGEFDLPTLEEARVSVSATLDPLGSSVELKHVQLRLPGLEVSGTAWLRTDLHGGEDGRTPFLIQQVDARGTLEPAVVTWLLNRPAAADEVQMQGPVEVTFRASRRDQSLRVDLSADATEMALRFGGDVLKPTARRLRYELVGELDDREWQFVADRSTLLVGDNRFEGSGSVRETARLLETYVRHRRDLTPEQLLADLRKVTWSGSFQINDPRSLSDLFPPLESVFGEVQLKGAVHGAVELNHADGTDVLLRLAVPADTDLAVGSLSLTKPPGREAAFELHGTLSPDPLTLDDVLCEARLGQAYVRVQKARVRLGGGVPRGADVPSASNVEGGLAFFTDQPHGAHSEGGTLSPHADGTSAPRLDLDVSGEFVAMRIEDLLLAMPAAERPRLRGSLHGSFNLQTDGTQFRTHLLANATRAAFDAEPFLVKPGDQPATADVDLFYTTDPNRPRNAELALKAQLPLGDVQLNAHTQPDGGFAVTGNANLRDASLLATTVPLTEPTLGGATLAGEATVSFDVRQVVENTATSTQCNVTVNADALAITPAPADHVTPAASPFTLTSRRKSAGVPLSFHANGLLASNDERLDLRLSIDNDANFRRRDYYSGARVDESRFSANLNMRLSRRDESAGYDIRQCSVGVFSWVILTDSLCQLLPELTPIVQQHELSGAVRMDGVLHYAPEDASDKADYRLTAHVDASRLAFRNLATLAKPADVLLWTTVGVSAPANLKTIHATVQTNAAETILNARAEFTNSAVANAQGLHWPILPQLYTAHASVDCRAAALLARLAPALDPYKLQGGATVEFELAGGDNLALPTVRTFQLHADGLAGTLGGKDWRLHGDFRVEDMDMRNPGGLRVERVLANELELVLGDNRLWLIADVQDLPVNPRGDVQILAGFLHDKDLLDWLTERQKELAARGVNAADGDELKPPPETLAADWLLLLRQHLTGADLRVSLSADTLRTFDRAVNQTYDVRMFQLDAELRQGLLQADYRGGLNGGLVSSRFETNLNDPAASLIQEIDIRELLSDETVRPQMAVFFPGNTVNGTFTRQGRLSAPMRDVLASLLDERFPLRWAGQVKTVTTDGFVEGQSAPGFVTRIFPGLNLTRYDYKTMTGFAEFLPDGNVRNDMLFSGLYDVYMTGATGPDNWGQYEVGLCLTPASAQWNHDWQQGRIPIFKFRGRIEGGKIHDQDVSYLWPDELLFKLFLERNVVYRAWVIRR